MLLVNLRVNEINQWKSISAENSCSAHGWQTILVRFNIPCVLTYYLEIKRKKEEENLNSTFQTVMKL